MIKKRKNTVKTAVESKQAVSNEGFNTPLTEMESRPFISSEPLPELPQSNAFDNESMVTPNTEQLSPVVECLQKRPNGDTCLDEFEKAQIHPTDFSTDQLKAINSLRNMCKACAAS